MQAGDFFEEEDLHRTAGRDLEPVQPGRNHPGVVEDQKIIVTKERFEISKSLVLEFPGTPMKHQKLGLVPAGRRVLGDLVRGQIKMKIFGDQGVSKIEIKVRAEEGEAGLPSFPWGP